MIAPDVRYVDGSLRAELASLRPYVLVTDPTPFELYAADIEPGPDRVFTCTSLERSHLRARLADIGGGHTVVGLGGGTVLDAAKYLACDSARPLVLVPTIASTNTAFTPFASVRENGSPVGSALADLRWKVVVDLGLIRRADPRLNRAGFGDLLGLATATADVRLAAQQGRGPAVDGELLAAADDVVARALSLADEVGRVSDDGLRSLVELLVAWSELTESCLGLGAGTEHLFAWNLERVTGRTFLHGEVVGLGVVVASQLQAGGSESLREALDRARVPWRPTQLGVDRSELAATLETIADYNEAARRIPSVVDTAAWHRSRLPALWEALG